MNINDVVKDSSSLVLCANTFRGSHSEYVDSFIFFLTFSRVHTSIYTEFIGTIYARRENF